MTERNFGVINIVEREPAQETTIMTSAGTKLLLEGWREAPSPKQRGETWLEIQVGSESYDLIGVTRDEMLAASRAARPYPLPPARPWDIRGVAYERLRVRLTDHGAGCIVALSDGTELSVNAISVSLDFWEKGRERPVLLLRLAPESYRYEKEEPKEA